MVWFEPCFLVHNIFVDSAHSPFGVPIAKLRRQDKFKMELFMPPVSRRTPSDQ